MSRPTMESAPIDQVHTVFRHTLDKVRLLVLGNIWIPELEADGISTTTADLRNNPDALRRGKDLLDFLGIGPEVDFEICEVKPDADSQMASA